jgi:thymidylate kinase
VYEFLEKFLNTTLLNQRYPAKYSEILNEINQKYSSIVNSRLSEIFSIENLSIENIKNHSSKKLLGKAFSRNLNSNPLKQIAIIFKFLFYHIKGKSKPNGFSFSITGPDGSGKTTIIDGVLMNLSNVYREVTYNHFRPSVLPRIAELFKKSGLKKEVDENYDKPHRGGETGKLSSLFRLFYYIIDYIIGYSKKVKPILFRRGIVIFDRYFTDIISDSKRSQINLNYKFIFFCRKFVPKMNYNFIVFVEPNAILERKQELTKLQINDIYMKLNYICKHDKSYTSIYNNKNPEYAINEILNFILVQQNIKYSKFFR